MNKSIIYLFLIPFFFIAFAVNAQNKAFKDFVSTVDSVYSDLTFNDVSLKDIRVDLKNHPNGIAFAYESPKNGKKSILINYQYLFKKVWQNDKYKYFTDSTNDKKKRTDIRIPIIKGILTHEWTHHFLNHNLLSPSILNERNADILSGRIMKEDIIQNGKGYLIDAVVELFGDLPNDRHHLPDTVRRNMIFKGVQTYEIIRANNDSLCSIANRNNQSELDKAKRNKYSEYKRCYRNEILKERKRIITFSKKELSESLLDLLNNSLTDTSLHTSPLSVSPFICTNLDIDSVLSISYKGVNKTVDSIEVSLKNRLKIDSVIKIVQDTLNKNLIKSVNINFPNCEKIFEAMKKITSEQFESDNSTVVESLYNRFYFDVKNCNCKSRIDKLRNPSLPDEQKDVLFYKLNGGLLIEIDLKNLKKGKAVTVIFNNKVKKGADFLAFKDDSKDGMLFKGYFEIMEGNKHLDKFFLDKNFHLWTETIAAKSIQNKLFLEHFTIKKL